MYSRVPETGPIVEALRQLSYHEAEKIGRFVYCHHCDRMVDMALLGRDELGRNVLRCGLGAHRLRIDPDG